jgi:DNA-binding transcriptional LysR family regulator
MLDLNDLRTFITVAEYSSFTEAGRHLHLSQPSVSQTIARLEKQYGVELFQRHGRAVRLTEAGQVLLAMGREMLTNASRLEEVLHSLNENVIGEINLGCSTTSGKYLLPRLIAGFRRQHPQVRVNVRVYNRKTVLRMLLDGQIPIGVASRKIEDADIEYCPFFTDDILLIAPRNHRWANYPRIQAEDLLEEPLILREETAGTMEVLLDALQRQDISPEMLNVAMILGNAEAIVMAVEEGIGVAFVSRLAAERSLQAGLIIQVDVQGLTLTRPIYMARNRKIPATRSQTAFWNYVQTIIQATLPSEDIIAAVD